MLNPLEEVLAKQISMHGPMDVGQFMAVALGHPEHGYYMKKDPFGADGDFVTAPEVSQLFGEMLGAWVADVWGQMGRPSRFALLECGPGRGTLMADMLRAVRGVGGFIEAVEVHFLEVSPVLRAAQRRALTGFNPRWHETLETVPDDVPVIVIGNEFLDALGFRSLQKTREGWCERVIAFDEDQEVFCFALRPAGTEIVAEIPFHLRGSAVGAVFEVAPVRNQFLTQVALRVGAQGGAALFVDYGHEKTAVGDTFQAVKGNNYVDVLHDVGEADLTSHVDFEALVGDVPSAVKVHGPVAQGAFLRALGIELRAQRLLAGASPEQGAELEKGLHRLIDSDQMGALFKVICLGGDDAERGQSLRPCGF